MYNFEGEDIKGSIAAAKSRQSCSTLCDPINGSPLGSSVHGIFQARVLEWVAIAFSDETVYSPGFSLIAGSSNS